MRAAPNNGIRAIKPLIKSPSGRKTCICPAKNKLKNPSPLNAKLEWPEGKLRHPSCKTWWSVCVHTSILTSVCVGVPSLGMHLDNRSGRGRPTAFFIKSVMNEVRSMAMKNERIVTWCLWECDRVAKSHSMMATNGRPPPYKNIIAINYQHFCSRNGGGRGERRWPLLYSVGGGRLGRR